MFESLVRPGVVSALLLLGFGAEAIPGSSGDRPHPHPALEETAPESDMTTRQAVSTRSRASARATASASSRASATTGNDAPDRACAAEAVVTTEVDGERVTVRRSTKSTGGQEPCGAEVRVESRSGAARQGND